MKITRSLAAFIAVIALAGVASAQCVSGGFGGEAGWGMGDGGMVARSHDGSVIADTGGNLGAYPPLPIRAAAAVCDPFHPWPAYAYSRAGIDATRTHTWNLNQAQMVPWHGAYYHRQWGQPLALVVPPTAAYHSVYSWGVAQTQSVPIYHQFRRPDPGPGMVGGAGFLPTPYWPSNTQQFGVYPVRGPW